MEGYIFFDDVRCGERNAARCMYTQNTDLVFEGSIDCRCVGDGERQAGNPAGGNHVEENKGGPFKGNESGGYEG